MGGLSTLALRNLARRPLRTGLTLAMVLLGTALIVFSVGLSEGTYDDLVRLATATWAGHFQVTREGDEEKPSLFGGRMGGKRMFPILEDQHAATGADHETVAIGVVGP